MTVVDAYSAESKLRKLHEAMSMPVWSKDFAADMFSGIWPEREEVIDRFVYCFLPGCWTGADRERTEDRIEDERWRNRDHAGTGVAARELGTRSPREWIEWWRKTQKRDPEWLAFVEQSERSGDPKMAALDKAIEDAKDDVYSLDEFTDGPEWLEGIEDRLRYVKWRFWHNADLTDRGTWINSKTIVRILVEEKRISRTQARALDKAVRPKCAARGGRPPKRD